MENDLTLFQPVIEDVKKVVSAGLRSAYSAISSAMVKTYWEVGRLIVEHEQQGDERAEYGKRLISALSRELTKDFGRGYSERNLHYFRKFYLYFPDEQIVNARVHNLTWTHFRSLLRVQDEGARLWYLNESAREGWSSRTLDRNISVQYYERLLQSQQKEIDVAEFLGLRTEDSFLESDLKSAILSKLRNVLLKMGRGFAFVASRQRVVTETDAHCLDLVFYNIELKRYVLIDLKMGTITRQDVERMDSCVRWYDEIKRRHDDAPTRGILLCSEKDKNGRRYRAILRPS